MSPLAMAKVLGEVTYKNWTLVFSHRPEDMYLQWKFTAPCSNTGLLQEWTTRKWRLSVHMTEGELVQTAFAAALQAEEHECRELFSYQGIRVFNPHISFDALLEAAQHTEGRA